MRYYSTKGIFLPLRRSLMKRILAIDDNLLILKSLRRLFLHSQYEIVIEEDPKKALDYLAENHVDVVISDMRMPFIDGYALLKEVKEKYPHIFRIVLSGYTDEKTVFEALKHNIAKLYIAKPWNDEELILRIDQIFETEAQLNSESIKTLVNNLEDIPTIKSSYKAILDLIEGNRDIGEIAKLIEKDPPIALKLLHIANSAFFGLKTGSVKHAAAFLGLRHLKTLVYTAGIIENYGCFDGSQVYIEILWRHAFLTNNIMQFIYEKELGKKVPDEIYSAGLLHNIGVAMLHSAFGKDYIKLLEYIEKEGCYVISEENDRFNLNHQEVGGYLIRWWDLPYPMVEAALYHHNPLDPRVINQELVYVMHIAQHYAWRIINSRIRNVFFLECFDRLKIDPNHFEKAFNTIKWL